jgi:hypothetical protein
MIGLYGLDSSESGQGPVVGSVEHSDEASCFVKCWEFLSSCTIGGFSRRVQLHEIKNFVLIMETICFM